MAVAWWWACATTTDRCAALAYEAGSFESFVVDVSFLDMGFLHQAINESGVCLLRRLPHEARHGEVALHLHVLLQPQPLFRHPQPQFLRLPRFAGQGPAERPAAFHVEAHGGKDVGLQSVGQVVEAAHECQTAVDAGEVGDLVADGVPLAMGFFGGGGRWRADRVTLSDEGVKVDHFGVGV